MSDKTGRSISGNATALADAGTGYLLSVNLCGGADAASITVRTGGATGTILTKVGTGAGQSTDRQFLDGVPYSNLHVTVTGTTPIWDLEVG